MGAPDAVLPPPGDLLVTGGAGFIGTNLIARLRERGFDGVIRVLDNETMGRRENLDGFGVDFRIGDVRDRQSISQALAGVTRVIHLAADTTVIGSIEAPVRNYEHNVLGTFNLLEAMRDQGVSKIINASTGGAIIGDAAPPVHEGIPPKPLSPYGASKLAAEGYCSAYSASYGFKAISLRFSNVYGPRSVHKGSVIAAFIKAIRDGKQPIIFGDGSQTRDYIFVRDLADGIIAALGHGGSGVFQLGSGFPTDLTTVVRTLESVSGQPIEPVHREFRVGEVRHTFCDVSRAREALGFVSTTSLEVGCAETWEWFCRTGVNGYPSAACP